MSHKNVIKYLYFVLLLLVSCLHSSVPPEIDLIYLKGNKAEWDVRKIPVVVNAAELESFKYDVFLATQYWNFLLQEEVFIFMESDLTPSVVSGCDRVLIASALLPDKDNRMIWGLQKYTSKVKDNYLTNHVCSSLVTINFSTPRRLIDVVVAHELGHSLGLKHTNKKGHLMFPTLEKNATLKDILIEDYIVDYLKNTYTSYHDNQ